MADIGRMYGMQAHGPGLIMQHSTVCRRYGLKRRQPPAATRPSFTGRSPVSSPNRQVPRQTGLWTASSASPRADPAASDSLAFIFAFYKTCPQARTRPRRGRQRKSNCACSTVCRSAPRGADAAGACDCAAGGGRGGRGLPAARRAPPSRAVLARKDFLDRRAAGRILSGAAAISTASWGKGHA